MAVPAATIGATATILMSNGGPGPNAHGRRVRQMTPRDERQQRLQYPQDQQAQQPHSNFVAKGASEFQLPGLPPSRPTRKSVLRRLSEALMRRSLTMVRRSLESPFNLTFAAAVERDWNLSCGRDTTSALDITSVNSVFTYVSLNRRYNP